MPSAIRNMEDKRAHPERNSITLRVQDIFFTQHTVGHNFKDGRSVESLTEELKKNTIKPEEVECIRVTWHLERWFALDNRRLRAFKDAGIQMLAVWALPFEEVKGEFYYKNTNPTIEGGGQLRHAPRPSERSHLGQNRMPQNK